MLACDAKCRHVFEDRAMRNVCDLDSHCGLACDANASNVGRAMRATKTLTKLPRDALVVGTDIVLSNVIMWVMCPVCATVEGHYHHIAETPRCFCFLNFGPKIVRYTVIFER